MNEYNAVDRLIFRLNFIALMLWIAVVLVVLVIVVLRVIIRAKRARLCIAKDYKAEGIILGRYLSTVLYSPSSNEGHAIVVGSSGSAKTTSVLIPTLKAWPVELGSFCIDISGDISKNVHMPNTLIFEPLKDCSIPYNPFHFIDKLTRSDQLIDALVNLAYILLPDTSTSENGKWFDDGGRDIIKAALICFYEKGMDFQDICRKVVYNDYSTLFSEIDQSDNKEAIRFINQFAGVSEKNISGCQQSAIAALQLYVSPVLDGKLRRPHFSDEFAVTPESIEGYHVFLRIDDAKKEQYARLIELITGQILEYISDRPIERCENKVLICIDEYASFKHLDMSEPLAKSRKKGCRIMLLCQNISQIARNHGEYAMKEILDNCDITVLCRVSEPESQRYFADKIGSRNTVFFKKQDTLEERLTKYRPEMLGRLRMTNIVIANGEDFRVRKNYFFKFKDKSKEVL